MIYYKKEVFFFLLNSSNLIDEIFTSSACQPIRCNQLGTRQVVGWLFT